jgi:hypothetical protein
MGNGGVQLGHVPGPPQQSSHQQQGDQHINVATEGRAAQAAEEAFSSSDGLPADHAKKTEHDDKFVKTIQYWKQDKLGVTKFIITKQLRVGGGDYLC